MNEQAAIAQKDVRTHVLDDPGVILKDPDVMRALVAASEHSSGENVVDIRGIAMSRLEERLQSLENMHRSVLAAAYENIAGMHQVHGAVTKLLEPLTFEDLLSCLDAEITDILRVGRIRMVLESGGAGMAGLARIRHSALRNTDSGFIEDYLGKGKPARRVTLRRFSGDPQTIYGPNANWVRSEACIVLDFGKARPRGMLALASEEPLQFSSNQGTDLLEFLGSVTERAIRRWLR